jgi:hypothetical protein
MNLLHCTSQPSSLHSSLINNKQNCSKKKLKEAKYFNWNLIFIWKLVKNQPLYLLGYIYSKTHVYVKNLGWTGYANYNVLFVNRLFYRYIRRQKNLYYFIAIGVFFWQFPEKPKLHLFTKNLMLSTKPNHVLR